MSTDAVAPARGTGDRGSGLVAGITFVFAFTFLGLVWLARDVDRSISNQSAAQSIAFQAARAGAQAAGVDGLRSGNIATLDEPVARQAALSIAATLFQSYGVDGQVTSISIGVGEPKVTVTVVIVDGGRQVTGVGSARAERAP